MALLEGWPTRLVSQLFIWAAPPIVWEYFPSIFSRKLQCPAVVSESDAVISTSITVPCHTHFDAQGFKSTACPFYFWETFLSLSPSVRPVFSGSPPPPASPPLPAVFAGSFSARHPEAAVAPASLPTSVFVVGDDMSKLWRAGEGRERGEGGRRHITRHGGKARDCQRMSCGLIFGFSLSFSLLVYVGWQEWRQEAPSPLPDFPPFIPSPRHSLLMSLLLHHPSPISSSPSHLWPLRSTRLPLTSSVLVCVVGWAPATWPPPPFTPQALLCIIAWCWSELMCVEVQISDR